MHSPDAPLISVHSGQLSLWQWTPGFMLITFPGYNLSSHSNAVPRPGGSSSYRGFTREFGFWVINGSFKRRTIVGPNPTFGIVTFYDRRGNVITNVTTGTGNTFVGLRHRAGIGAVVLEHSTDYPIIDDVWVGRVFKSTERMFDTYEFYARHQ